MLPVPKPSSLANSMSGCWMVTYPSSVSTPASRWCTRPCAAPAAAARPSRKLGQPALEAGVVRQSGAALVELRAARSVAPRALRTSGSFRSPASSGTAVRSRSSMQGVAVVGGGPTSSAVRTASLACCQSARNSFDPEAAEDQGDEHGYQQDRVQPGGAPASCARDSRPPRSGGSALRHRRRAPAASRRAGRGEVSPRARSGPRLWRLVFLTGPTTSRRRRPPGRSYARVRRIPARQGGHSKHLANTRQPASAAG